MKKILMIFGTRPEAVKMAPLAIELKKREDIDLRICLTGQHREMAEATLSEFGISAHIDLGIMKEAQSLSHITSAVLCRVGEVIEREAPQLLMVHGDTSSAFGGALSGFYHGIPIAHVEAGLRTGNISEPFPEEFNRRAISLISDYNFAPTERAADNLLREGVHEKRIYLTGNTVVDALRYTVGEEYSSPRLEWAAASRLILVTAHRRENIGKPLEQMLSGILRAVDMHDDVKVIYPIHPNPRVRECAYRILSGHERILLCDPLCVRELHNIIHRSYMTVTDSGGIQEESVALSKPVLVMRNTTERQEGVDAGGIMLLGTKSDSVCHGICRMLNDKEEYKKYTHSKNPFGDGNASKRIADIIA